MKNKTKSLMEEKVSSWLPRTKVDFMAGRSEETLREELRRTKAALTLKASEKLRLKEKLKDISLIYDLLQERKLALQARLTPIAPATLPTKKPGKPKETTDELLDRYLASVGKTRKEVVDAS